MTISASYTTPWDSIVAHAGAKVAQGHGYPVARRFRASTIAAAAAADIDARCHEVRSVHNRPRAEPVKKGGRRAHVGRILPAARAGTDLDVPEQALLQNSRREGFTSRIRAVRGVA